MEIIRTVLHNITGIGNWFYVILFLAVFLECSAFIGLLVPGEIMVLLAGFLAGRGYLNLIHCLWISILGALLGDSAGYQIGKTMRSDYFERREKLLFLKKKHLKKADRYFRKYGGKTIFIARFIGVLRTVVPFSAGMSRMSYRKFLAYNVSGGIIWVSINIFLGYFFGESWSTLEKWFGRASYAIAGLVLIIAVLVYFLKKKRNRG